MVHKGSSDAAATVPDLLIERTALSRPSRTENVLNNREVAANTGLISLRERKTVMEKLPLKLSANMFCNIRKLSSSCHSRRSICIDYVNSQALSKAQHRQIVKEKSLNPQVLAFTDSAA